MSSTAWEQETLALLQDAEKDKRNAELALEKASLVIRSKEQDIAALKLALDHYRKKYGLPSDPIPSSIANEDYGHLGPSAAVALWADKHNGEVIVKELANELLSAHAYSDYRVAYNSVYTVLKRDTGYQKVKAGHYRRTAIQAQPAQPAQPPLAPECQEVFGPTISGYTELKV